MGPRAEALGLQAVKRATPFGRLPDNLKRNVAIFGLELLAKDAHFTCLPDIKSTIEKIKASGSIVGVFGLGLLAKDQPSDDITQPRDHHAPSKSFAGDLDVRKGPVSSRVALLLRSAETAGGRAITMRHLRRVLKHLFPSLTMHITSPNPWGLPQPEGHSAPRAAYRDFIRTGRQAETLGLRAIINREFDSLALSERKAVGIFGLELLAKDQPCLEARQKILGLRTQPEFIDRLERPRLEDIPYYADVIKAAAEAIEAMDQYQRMAANSSQGPFLKIASLASDLAGRSQIYKRRKLSLGSSSFHLIHQQSTVIMPTTRATPLNPWKITQPRDHYAPFTACFEALGKRAEALGLQAVDKNTDFSSLSDEMKANVAIFGARAEQLGLTVVKKDMVYILPSYLRFNVEIFALELLAKDQAGSAETKIRRKIRDLNRHSDSLDLLSKPEDQFYFADVMDGGEGDFGLTRKTAGVGGG
ncbi:hypothetical protein LX32DRAFT_649126 [Colletotrichum zoysiae]|uniref:Uncharacterized protein n=1 Tax=Colletotrichum zoysiae TaxID=1216348 RepID=A0AAD9HR16_9PEZI|nr:hypothetical protein LX32DRAFT_649126 [Colletotrichum zoysiae]